MPTENPKISAYVPQNVYDAIEHFKNKHSLASMSQAAILIFAGYLGIDLSKESSQEPISELPSRFTELELKVVSLENLVYDLSREIENIKSTSKPPTNLTSSFVSDNILIDDDISHVELVVQEKDTSRLQESNSNIENVVDSIQVEGEAESISSQSELLKQNSCEQQETQSHGLTLQDSELLKEEGSQHCGSPSEPLNGLDSYTGNIIKQPIFLDANLLASRLGFGNPQSLQNKKVKFNHQEFTNWISNRDPDNIAWVYRRDGKKGFYYAPDDLSQEVKEKLLNWISTNKP